MKNIPTEGIYCGECPCHCGCRCFAFPDEEGIPQALAWFSTPDDFRRLRECVDLKPQVLTLADRLRLKAKAYQECREEQVREELRKRGVPHDCETCGTTGLTCPIKDDQEPVFPCLHWQDAKEAP